MKRLKLFYTYWVENIKVAKEGFDLTLLIFFSLSAIIAGVCKFGKFTNPIEAFITDTQLEKLSGICAAILFSVWCFLWLPFRRHEESAKEQNTLVTRCWFFPKFEDFNVGARVKVEAVNNGVRPIILTEFGVEYDNGKDHFTLLGFHREGITLTDKQTHILEMEDIEYMLYDAQEDAAAVSMWFVDTLKNRYLVKDSKNVLKLYFENK